VGEVPRHLSERANEPDAAEYVSELVAVADEITQASARLGRARERRLRAIRRAQAGGLTQEEIAKVLGLGAKQHVSRILRSSARS